MDREQLLMLCSRDEAAADLIAEAWNFAIVYDDAVDGDKRNEKAIHRAMQWALIGLHDNPFMQRHPDLKLVLQVAIAEWRAANQFERSREPEKLRVAHVLRCSPYSFFVAVVLKASGPDMAATAAELFYSSNPGDSLDAYLAEHTEGA
jgi:hypothetical protein